MNVGYWLRKPHLIWARLRYWVWEKINPTKPWLSPGAVAYCAGALKKTMRALEFGSGRGTAWFARQVGHLTSVEHSAAWFNRVRAQIARSGLDNVDYRLVPLDHPDSEPERENYDPLPSYVAVLSSFPDEGIDFIVVDGHYRTTCIRACPPKLKAGGLLLVDDTNMWGGSERVPVPTGWRLVHRSGNGIKSAAIWQKPARKPSKA